MMRSENRRNIIRSKAEQPLLLLFPGCCNDAPVIMRIRKGQSRLSNASARGESNASTSLTAASKGSQDQHDTTGEFLLIEERSHISGNAEQCVDVQERVGVMFEAPASRSVVVQPSAKRSPIPPDRPHMNLDEFVNSLARKNCFPDEDFINPYSDYHQKAGESSGLINFSGPGDDTSIPYFSRMDSGCSVKNAEEVDTSLRLAISPREITPAAELVKKVDGGNFVINNGEFMAGTLDDGRKQKCTTKSVSEARMGSALEAGETNIARPEAYGQSYYTAQTTLIPESTEIEIEAGQPDQTMKSSTESMERRPRRASRSTGRRRKLPSPAAINKEQIDNVEQEEVTSSDISSQRVKTRKRKRKKSLVSVSSSTLAIQDSEKRNQIAGLRSISAGESASKRSKTKKERKGSNSRSGRPKKLKYMKQENTEELGNQCNRSDGKGWTCPLLAKTGYQLCDHHLDKLRCKPGSRSKYNKKKKGAATLS